MKLVQINLGNHGSTGSIMRGIHDAAVEKGIECYDIYPKSKYNVQRRNKDIFISCGFFSKFSHLMDKITGYQGCFYFFETKCIIDKLNEIKPDIIQLHNIHQSNLNYAMLFNYIKKHDIKTVWTLHDCWSFTGQCPHFTMVKCEKWRTGCYSCPQYREYPAAYVDCTQAMWKLKKKWFTGVRKMKIVVPSNWLKKLVAASYMQQYDVHVIYNGIDTETFTPISSDFRRIYNIADDDYIVLGVASPWSRRKGLDVFKKLAALLPKNYKIVLVGTDPKVEADLPQNILSIPRTNNAKELAAIYTAADVYVNPTREEVLGLVNLESLSCGTPIVMFNTGGAIECIDDKTGIIVPVDDIDKLKEEIYYICETKKISIDDCIKRAQMFDKKEKYKEYIELYNSL